VSTPQEIPVRAKTPIPEDTQGRLSAPDIPTAEHLPTHPAGGNPLTIGPYQVVKLIGRGGMGSVYLAKDPLLDRRVAIKMLRLDHAENAIAKERFFREARIAAGLKHDHIVTIYSIGEQEGIPYLAMEYLAGMSLERLLQRKRQLSWFQIARIGRELAKALAAAHEKGLIHRDIKPANVWLEQLTEEKGGKTRVKLLDFGLARFAQQAAGPTQAGMVVGSPHYISPEQARGKDLDGRSDLFSLGVVLYRASTHRFPFNGEDTISLLTSLALDDPKPISQYKPDVPEQFEELILRLMAKDPDDRPASAAEVVEELYAIDRTLQGKGAVRSSSKHRKLTSKANSRSQRLYEALLSPPRLTILGLCALIALLTIALLVLIIYKAATR
jgi:serine/threonine protein kinase